MRFDQVGISLLFALNMAWLCPALAAAGPPAPGVQNETSIATLSGGIGIDEQQSMLAARGDFNLHLTFAAQGSGAYLADVSLLIFDAAGKQLLMFDAVGPLFYARLTPGRYRIQASVRGKVVSQTTTLGASGARDLHFYWTVEPDKDVGGEEQER